jgi:hypothetical protein
MGFSGTTEEAAENSEFHMMLKKTFPRRLKPMFYMNHLRRS